MKKKISAVTLVELIVSATLLFLLILGFYSIDLFSRYHLMDSDKKIKTQNELSYSIEQMGKYTQQGIGVYNNSAIQYYPSAGAATGFKVRVDFNNPQTPADLTDDSWVNYYLSGNSLYTSCSGPGCPYATELLTDKLCSNFVAGAMPLSPTAGFYANIIEQGTTVDVGLVGRYKPNEAAGLDNPQVSLKTRLTCSNSSAK